MEAWTSASPGAAPYRPFVEHWTVPDFATYVAALAAAADRALAAADEGAEEAFLETARLEGEFWQMAWGA
jgi:thiaminase